MLEPLDMRTMLQVGAMACLILAVVMVYYSLARKTYPGFHYWTLGIVSVSIGAVLISMRGVLPDFITIIVGNFLIVLMPFTLAFGLSEFFSTKWKWMPSYVFILFLFSLLYLWLTYGSPNLPARVISLCLVLAILFSENLRILLSNSKFAFEKTEWILVIFLSFSIVASLYRISTTIVNFESFAFLNPAGLSHSIALLSTILGIVGLACSFIILNSHRIERDLIQANKRIEKLANVDGLTNLFNRRFFDKRLNDEFKRALRSSRTISLILADIDNFKLYNDTYGHQSGDDCIRAIASIFIDFARRVSDVAARYGGEELALLLPDTDSDGAQNIASAIQKQVKAKAIPHGTSSVSNRVTISIGIATILPNNTMQPEDLVKFADEALYISSRP